MTTASPRVNFPDVHALDKAHVLHPWTNFGPFEAEGSTVIERGQGSHIWDDRNRKYFDAVGGLWCTNIGLGRKEMAEAIAAQVEKLAFANPFVDVTTEPHARLAAEIAARAPGDLNRVHFTTCGSTAVDSAYRLMQFYQACRGNPGKTGIVARRQSYHGSTHMGQSIGKRDGDRVPQFSYQREGIHHLTSPNLYRAPAGLDEAAFCDFLVQEFEDLIAEVGADRIGGFIAEPIQASGGVIVPPRGYLRRMAEVCRRNDILVIFDEVVTGFGRIGHWFASEAEFGVVPDMITCAKGLTSGYLPLGGLIFSDRVWDVMAEDGQRWFTSGFTYSGHPVSCVAGLKTLEIMEREDILGNVMTAGAVFEEAAQGLADLPTVGQVRGKKMMICVENVADKASRALLPDEAKIGKRITDRAARMGLLVRPMGHLNVMSPPLIMTEAEAEWVIETLGRAIRGVTDDLVRDGFRVN